MSELLGSPLCLRVLPEGGRCHELLSKDGELWRCTGGHFWDENGETVRPGLKVVPRGDAYFDRSWWSRFGCSFFATLAAIVLITWWRHR